MHTNLISTLILAALLALAPLHALADAISSPGKTTAAVSQSGVLNTAPTLSVQIVKGKKKRLLIVTGTVSTFASAGTISAEVVVNGISLEPIEGGTNVVAQRCAGAACSLEGTWWLDVDAAESANPGMFYNVPLDVVMTANASTATTGRASLTATLVKK